VKKCVESAKCEKPETITSKFMRKYISTVSQIIALTPNELEWLTGHLGRSTDVHKLFYRMHISTMELEKISNLLTAIDQGKAHNMLASVCWISILMTFMALLMSRHREQ